MDWKLGILQLFKLSIMHSNLSRISFISSLEREGIVVSSLRIGAGVGVRERDGEKLLKLILTILI